MTDVWRPSSTCWHPNYERTCRYNNRSGLRGLLGADMVQDCCTCLQLWTRRLQQCQLDLRCLVNKVPDQQCSIVFERSHKVQ